MYSLDSPNTAISGYAGPYGSVSVSLVDNTHANIMFTSLVNGGNIYLFGDGGSVDVNVNATSWLLSGITGNNSGTGFTLGGPFTDGGSGNVSAFGVLNQTINTFDGFSHSSDTISFMLENTSGTWANDASVLTPNADGISAAAHIFVTSSPANKANGAIVTGFAGDGGGSTFMPDGGSTLALTGLAVAALVSLRRKVC